MQAFKSKTTLIIVLAGGLMTTLLFGEPFRQPLQAQPRPGAPAPAAGPLQMIVKDTTVFVFDSTTGQCWYRDTSPKATWNDLGTPLVKENK